MGMIYQYNELRKSFETKTFKEVKVLDYRKLEGRIKEIYGTQTAFAEAMEMKQPALSQRLKGSTEWKTSEIAQACDLLDIPLSEAHVYFFTLKV